MVSLWSNLVPFQKYALSLYKRRSYDCLLRFITGKIAASSGHAAWISSKKSRERVFELRGRSDAVIVGGNTVRKDSKYSLSFKCHNLYKWKLIILILNFRSTFNCKTWRRTSAYSDCDDTISRSSYGSKLVGCF